MESAHGLLYHSSIVVLFRGKSSLSTWGISDSYCPIRESTCTPKCLRQPIVIRITCCYLATCWNNLTAGSINSWIEKCACYIHVGLGKNVLENNTPIVSFYRLSEALSVASDELEKSSRTIKRLEEQQQSARGFLNMEHFTFVTDSKLARYVD